jgi:imidazolonepropionase
VLARAGVVAVLLPAAALTLGQPLPKVALARAVNARVAVATDFNPGTSPAQSLVECAALAARLAGLNAEESLLALTWNAARALGVEAQVGHLDRGARADLVIWDCETLEELTYWMPAVRAATVLVDGRSVGATAREA